MRMEKMREDLHQIPELGFQEYKTKRYILSHLKKMNCIIHEVGETSILAYFDNRKSTTIGIRCEMDGLPMCEETGVEYTSIHNNRMHACGHDAHMATILELGYFISEHFEKCSSNVLLVFQAGEELTGGALEICRSGYLERYHLSMMLGVHIWPELTEGIMYSRGGVLLASSDEVDIQVVGKSVHVAQYDSGNDALLTASELLLMIRDMEECGDSLFYIGKCNGGSARNIVANECVLSGTLRTSNEDERLEMIKGIERVIKRVDMKYHTTTTIHIRPCHPLLNNSIELFHKIQSIYQVHQCDPFYQSEDFGYYAQYCPLLYALLGYGNEHSLHSPNYLPNIRLLQTVYEYYKVWITNVL